MTEIKKVKPGLYETEGGRYQIRKEPDGSSWHVWDKAQKRYVEGAHYFEVLRDAKRWVERRLL